MKLPEKEKLKKQEEQKPNPIETIIIKICLSTFSIIDPLEINKKDYSSAMDMANNLYHLSKETYKGGNIITGLFKDSYKEHWDKEKDQLMTRIKEK